MTPASGSRGQRNTRSRDSGQKGGITGAASGEELRIHTVSTLHTGWNDPAY